LTQALIDYALFAAKSFTIIVFLGMLALLLVRARQHSGLAGDEDGGPFGGHQPQ
jgi:hypothetical protein